MSDRPPSRVPRHIVIMAHPGATSFNATIAKTYCDTVRSCGHEAVLRDLYAIGFDPLLKDHERPGTANFAISPDVERELAAIRDGDVYVLVYPIWFGMPPAMLKGYIDRVIGSGVTAREVQDRTAQGVLRDTHMLSIVTSGAREIWLDEHAQIESLKNVMSRYLFHAFGISRADHLQFGGIVEGFAENFIQENLLDVIDCAKRLCRQIDDDRLALDRT